VLTLNASLPKDLDAIMNDRVHSDIQILRGHEQQIRDDQQFHGVCRDALKRNGKVEMQIETYSEMRLRKSHRQVRRTRRQTLDENNEALKIE
jgi:hypothetical protein